MSKKNKANRKTIIKRNNNLKNKTLSLYGKLSNKHKCVAYCELHKCYLEPFQISEKKCNYKQCIYLREI